MPSHPIIELLQLLQRKQGVPESEAVKNLRNIIEPTSLDVLRKALAQKHQTGIPFGENLFQNMGLTGLDPRMVKDPRFDVQGRIDPKSNSLILGSQGENVFSSLNPGIDVKYLADVDDETLANDMWAVTQGGKQGTSEGDRSSDWFINNAKDIMGDAKYPTKAHLDELRKRLIQQRYGEVRQTHPGKGGYTPEGLRY